jgi:hypothetical protein
MPEQAWPSALAAPSTHAHEWVDAFHCETPALQAEGFVVHAPEHATQLALASQKPPVHAVSTVLRSQPVESTSLRFVPPQLLAAHA